MTSLDMRNLSTSSFKCFFLLLACLLAFPTHHNLLLGALFFPAPCLMELITAKRKESTAEQESKRTWNWLILQLKLNLCGRMIASAFSCCLTSPDCCLLLASSSSSSCAAFFVSFKQQTSISIYLCESILNISSHNIHRLIYLFFALCLLVPWNNFFSFYWCCYFCAYTIECHKRRAIICSSPEVYFFLLPPPPPLDE